MSLPLRDDERCDNCTVVKDDLQRGREPLTATEPRVGRCIVWRVLGFGGRPNPLLYSRAASFAARTAQALLGSPERGKQTAGLARCRLQLYVDDPVVPAVGYPEEIECSFDIMLLWWMVLGIPYPGRKERPYHPVRNTPGSASSSKCFHEANLA